MLEIVNQLDGFDSRGNIKVTSLPPYSFSTVLLASDCAHPHIISIGHALIVQRGSSNHSLPVCMAARQRSHFSGFLGMLLGRRLLQALTIHYMVKMKLDLVYPKR